MLWRLLLCLFIFCLLGQHVSASEDSQKFLVLCYHSVPVKAHQNDIYAVSRHSFIKQIEYLRTHGYNPLSLGQVRRAAKGLERLPDKAFLLTFDDAYASFADFVAPVLREYGYPSVLAVVGSWIEKPPENLSEKLMTWDQIQKVADDPLVEVVSHTYGLHYGIPYTPQGNVGPAGAVRAYLPNKDRYEDEDGYVQRLRADFQLQEDLFREKLGFTPQTLVWPYGAYTCAAMETAESFGYEAMFNLEEGFAHLDRLEEINRVAVRNPLFEGSAFIDEFIEDVKKAGQEERRIRAVQVDLDLIYEPGSPERTDWNLGRLIDRLAAMKINTVYLQAFSDLEGSGNIRSVYFQNSILPVKADIFGHVVHQMRIRDMRVYAWMPTLSVVLPDRDLSRSLRVRERIGKATRPSHSWYKRLTPFSEETECIMKSLYADMAAHSQIQGVLFQDDAYLAENEDFHPGAIKRLKQMGDSSVSASLGKPHTPIDSTDSEMWTRLKTSMLIDFTEALADSVRRHCPNCSFARNIYAPVIIDPQEEKNFAQAYDLFLRHYDEVVVMAYPALEGRMGDASRWLKTLVQKASEEPYGLDRTVFKIQAYDWGNDEWIDEHILLEWLREIQSAGGLHLAYYPDDLWEDRPKKSKIMLEMSRQDFPFMP